MNNHICGLYCLLPDRYPPARYKRCYLPQVKLDSHTTILSTASRTKLSQSFVNPSQDKAIKEVRYTFPLYDGVSVVGFICRVGDRVITGQVKEREKARAVFEEAVQRGETAGLLEQLPDASDVFTTTIGNIPPNAKIVVEITYLGELKHDAEVDGIRFTIPTAIAPRYGNYPGELLGQGGDVPVAHGGISITVDATMPDGSFIREMRSPSHPIAVSMGTTSLAPSATPTMSKASATLSLGKAALDNDFVLQVIAKDTGIPKALLETHPTIPQHRALMATLVPKFSLPPSRPEIVFICDRSGSMAGSSIRALVAALRVFLKSLPVGVKFNICSFGSSYYFLWDRSKAYSKASLDEAMRHVESFAANLGGTEMFPPIKETFARRYKDMALEVFLVTDGEIWDQQSLFNYLNKEVIENKAPIRVFTLGIGSGASSALVEGVARAGNGFSQAVADPNEKLDAKVVRMLKGALSPHVTDYTLEVKYGDDDTDDFEIVEKVSESLTLKLDLTDKDVVDDKKKKPISLFDDSMDIDNDATPSQTSDPDGQARYSHLPAVPAPKLLQAPQRIPPLFPFIRTSVYLLLSPSACQKTPISVVLRGTSPHGPLQLEIPIEDVGSGETIHQLAAKKAIAELEQGRGWLQEAVAEDGQLLKQKYEGRFDEMVERDAVRLGVQFQVGGKWCSFVAVEETERQHGGTRESDDTADFEYLDSAFKNMQHALNMPLSDKESSEGQKQGMAPQARASRGASARFRAKHRGQFGQPSDDPLPSSLFGGFCSGVASTGARSLPLSAAPTAARLPPSPSLPQSFGMFGSSTPKKRNVSAASGPPPPVMPYAAGLGQSGLISSGAPQGGRPLTTESSAPSNTGFGMFGAPGSGGLLSTQRVLQAQQAQQTQNALLRSGKPTLTQQSRTRPLSTGQTASGLFRSLGAGQPSSGQPVRRNRRAAQPEGMEAEEIVGMDCEAEVSDDDFDIAGARFLRRSPVDVASYDPTIEDSGAGVAEVPIDPLQALIALQDFEGCWEWSASLFNVVGVQEAAATRAFEGTGLGSSKKNIIATVLAIAFFETKLRQDEESWELVVEKAREWLEANGGDRAEVAEYQEIAKGLLK